MVAAAQARRCAEQHRLWRPVGWAAALRRVPVARAGHP